MTYPNYDTSILPELLKPFESEQERTKNYLGGRTKQGEQYATLQFNINDDAHAEKLYRFWSNDCNGGTTPFNIAIPLHGMDYDDTYHSVTAKFVTKIILKKIGLHWTCSAKIKIVSIGGLMPSASLTPSATLTPK